MLYNFNVEVGVGFFALLSEKKGKKFPRLSYWLLSIFLVSACGVFSIWLINEIKISNLENVIEFNCSLRSCRFWVEISFFGVCLNVGVLFLTQSLQLWSVFNCGC